MRMLNGEVRQIGISVVSQADTAFVISYADYAVQDSKDAIVEQGSATIEGHKVVMLFSATTNGSYTCEFTYRIGAEILKAKINVSVT
jgi:hypothetical protein